MVYRTWSTLRGPALGVPSNALSLGLFCHSLLRLGYRKGTLCIKQL
jgi:hypothetical protein